MDVLVYSALNEQAALKKEIHEKQQCLFDLKKNILETGGGGGAAAVDGFAEHCAKAWFDETSNQFEKKMWRCPGEMSTLFKPYEGQATGEFAWTDGITICDASGTWRCGSDCTWTVPSGATKARFQLWGSGGGANKAPCCCGHTPFGSTGAYASVVIPVTSGWAYTLCGGCAYCCYAYTTSGSNRWSGCPSYVQGCHLNNFCADGGQGPLGTWNAMRGNYCTCRLSAITHDSEGAYICNYGGDWCYTGASFNCIPYVSGAGYHGSICEIESPTYENVIYGLRGTWPMQCWDGNHYGWEQHAPIWGGTGSTWMAETICCGSFSSGTCCGYNCGAWTGNGCLKYPGAGGWGSHAMGGSNALCGDSGKFGMVCVSWR